MNFSRNDISINNPLNLSIQITKCGMITAMGKHSSLPFIYERYSLTFVVRGSGTYTINGKTHGIQAGTAFLTAPGSTTNWSTGDEAPWQYVYLIIQGTEHRQLLKNLGLGVESRIFSFSDKSEHADVVHDTVSRNILSLYAQFERDNTMTYGQIGLFYQIANSIYLLNGVRKERNSLSPNEHFEKARIFIEDNYSSNISVRDIADFTGIDRSHLYRLFVQRAGKSPQMYLTDFRLAKATAMIETGAYTNTDVAIASGFYDYSHFAHAFQKKYGIRLAQFSRDSKK